MTTDCVATQQRLDTMREEMTIFVLQLVQGVYLRSALFCDVRPLIWTPAGSQGAAQWPFNPERKITLGVPQDPPAWK